MLYEVITLAYLGSDQTSLASLQTATGQDANSVSTDPVFTNAGGLQVSDYYPSATLTGVDGSGVTTDFYDITRSTPPKMGALESNNYIWHGSTSTDFATSSNWANGSVPPNGADIVFAADPDNSCVLDQNRTIKSITNAQSTDQLVLNGHQLTITGNLNLSIVYLRIMYAIRSYYEVFVFDGTGIEYADPVNQWDGKRKDKELPSGSYVFILIVNNDDTHKGTISLIR